RLGLPRGDRFAVSPGRESGQERRRPVAADFVGGKGTAVPVLLDLPSCDGVQRHPARHVGAVDDRAEYHSQGPVSVHGTLDDRQNVGRGGWCLGT
ncbi:hypothetical protein, partial [Gemmatimonas sp.]|uniref:hypothetical protein n=1 Tax=Gemmatimonas sp. TaxID=1962908 RepID=UPI00391F3D4A